ncbi:MAG TPA: cytochrome c oxidase subunit 4 [Candidatus Micrarchaeia archaeon]|nr:cytochrome c oxidase subunit 4 [Candidatus Micrarchaeia archaeon]
MPEPAPDAEQAAASAHGTGAPHAIHLPPPSYWPIVLAVGMAMALIGVITQYVVVAIGLLITLVALAGWIRDARREYRSLS